MRPKNVCGVNSHVQHLSKRFVSAQNRIINVLKYFCVGKEPNNPAPNASSQGAGLGASRACGSF